jgi:hypothetical protein
MIETAIAAARAYSAIVPSIPTLPAEQNPDETRSVYGLRFRIAISI